jgi:hypothetical protein
MQAIEEKMGLGNRQVPYLQRCQRVFKNYYGGTPTLLVLFNEIIVSEVISTIQVNQEKGDADRFPKTTLISWCQYLARLRSNQNHTGFPIPYYDVPYSTKWYIFVPEKLILFMHLVGYTNLLYKYCVRTC